MESGGWGYGIEQRGPERWRVKARGFWRSSGSLAQARKMLMTSSFRLRTCPSGEVDVLMIDAFPGGNVSEAGRSLWARPWSFCADGDLPRRVTKEATRRASAASNFTRWANCSQLHAAEKVKCSSNETRGLRAEAVNGPAVFRVGALRVDLEAWDGNPCLTLKIVSGLNADWVFGVAGLSGGPFASKGRVSDLSTVYGESEEPLAGLLSWPPRTIASAMHWTTTSSAHRRRSRLGRNGQIGAVGQEPAAMCSDLPLIMSIGLDSTVLSLREAASCG